MKKVALSKRRNQKKTSLLVDTTLHSKKSLF